MKELKANPNRAAKGIVIEARPDKKKEPQHTRLIDLSALVVNHDSDASDGRTGNDNIAGMERTVLDKESSYGTSYFLLPR